MAMATIYAQEAKLKFPGRQKIIILSTGRKCRLLALRTVSASNPSFSLIIKEDCHLHAQRLSLAKAHSSGWHRKILTPPSLFVAEKRYQNLLLKARKVAFQNPSSVARFILCPFWYFRSIGQKKNHSLSCDLITDKSGLARQYSCLLLGLRCKLRMPMATIYVQEAS
nr:hypothetical protein C4D60_Mb04t36080 [Ipomoea batatas]